MALLNKFRNRFLLVTAQVVTAGAAQDGLTLADRTGIYYITVYRTAGTGSVILYIMTAPGGAWRQVLTATDLTNHEIACHGIKLNYGANSTFVHSVRRYN